LIGQLDPPTTQQAPPEYVTQAEYKRVCRERDHYKQAAAKLSIVASALQNPELTWQERSARPAVAMALEAQRPTDNRTAEFRVDLGDLAKRAGLIPPTPVGDEDAWHRAFKSGRKLAGQIVKDLATEGVIEHRYVSRAHDEHGNVEHSSVIVQITRPSVEVLRGASQKAEGTRTFQNARHHNGSRPYCKDCGKDAPVIQVTTTRCVCGRCGQPLTDPVTTKRELPPEKTNFQSLETAEDDPTYFDSLETLGTENTQEDGRVSYFQSIEIAPDHSRADALDELKAAPQWVFWKFKERDGKRTKPPYDPATGNEAKSNDPTTWGTFTEAWTAKQRYAGAGVGFMFHGDYVGIDIDGCRDKETGAIDPEAQSIIDELQSYTEVSPSGTGVHIFVRGSLPATGRRKGNLEMYDGGRYFTMTGHHLEGTPRTIVDRGEALMRLHGRIFPPAPAVTRTVRPAMTASDGAVLEKAGNARNGEKFRSLMAGNIVGYGSRSDADLALCGLLTYWTNGDVEQMDRLFRQSGLMREKWERDDYRERTIALALGGRRDA
jgi:hypothetical protein